MESPSRLQIIYFCRRIAFGLGIVSLASLTTLGSFSLLLQGESSPPGTSSAKQESSPSPKPKISISSLIFTAQKAIYKTFSSSSPTSPPPSPEITIEQKTINPQRAIATWHRIPQTSPPPPQAEVLLPQPPKIPPSPSPTPQPSPDTNAIAVENSPSQPKNSTTKPTYQHRVAALKESSSNQTSTSQFKLTLENAIILALQNNRQIKNAYLDRIIDRQNLAVAEDEFVPNFSPRIFTDFVENRFGDNSTSRGEIGIDTGLTMDLPTGGNIQILWQGRRNWQEIAENIWNQEIAVNIEQPLLQDAGIDVNREPIERARIQEKINILTLKNSLIGTIDRVTRAYRNLIQAQQALIIRENALQSTKRQLEVTQALIDAGRRPGIDIVSSQSSVAEQEVELQRAQNNLQEAQLNLLEILDIQRDRDMTIIAAETPSLENINLETSLAGLEIENITLDSLTVKKLLPIALANNPDYLQAKLAVEIEKLDLLLAKNERLWQFDVTGGYRNNLDTSSEDSQEFRVGLQLQREFGDLRREQSVSRARIQLQKEQNRLKEERENLTIELQNRLRDLRFQRRQITLEQEALQLTEQQLENEREKLRLGVDVSILDIANLEDDVVEAQNRELQAVIDYLNQLTSLQITLGTTLKRWGVSVEAVDPSGNQENGENER
ncbi:TolC family protein [Geitlerinema sp. PCC 9228]|uniref:TolC family protein n=1 Tax=Geitlerinema sp. PCC 9228 TaxID=111611 RepID=UPI0008F990BB|nr:TolC family protein [Geitlerinema sp. PCC 9228]